MQILNQIDPSAHAAPAAAAASSPAASQAGATVTANDFLTLLVAEMKNQDPTANTDPNAYINQLVQVNSLQQLIQVNQTLSGMGTVGTSASGGVKPAARAVSAASQLATALAPSDSGGKPAVAQSSGSHV